MRSVFFFRNLRNIGFSLGVVFAAVLLSGLVMPVSADEDGYTEGGWMGAPDWLLERMDTSIMPELYIPKNTTDKTGEAKPTSGSYISEGNNLLISGSYADAKVSYEKAIALKPESYDAWAGRGMALEGLKRYQTALDSYEKAISFSGSADNSWIAYAGKGRVSYHMNDYTSASKAIEKAIEGFEGSGESSMEDLIQMYEKLAEIKQKMGDEVAASDAHQKAEDLRSVQGNSS